MLWNGVNSNGQHSVTHMAHNTLPSRQYLWMKVLLTGVHLFAIVRGLYPDNVQFGSVFLFGAVGKSVNINLYISK